MLKTEALALAQDFADHLNTLPGERNSYSLDTPGSKFVRIVITNSQVSVYCFVELSTGLVYKAAGWKAPAKGARFDLSGEASRASLYANADAYGGVFYRGALVSV
jgi:hypothetical protein